MRASRDDVERLLRAGGGLVARRQHPELRDALAYLVRCGRLQTVLPGVYADAGAAEVPLTRMRALCLWDPDAVLTGRAAARLTFWPELAVGRVGAAVRRTRQSQPGFTFAKWRVPAELVVTVHGLRCTSPALTALDLSPVLGGDVLDHALRSRTTTLASLAEALRLTPSRTGNVDRRRLLFESRDGAWSPAEREAHRLLHAERITGWVANYPLPLLGVVYYVDLAFPGARLAVEIDGRSYHTDAAAFERDRWRQNDIVLAGWRVLRFTPEMLQQRPQVVVAVLRRALQFSDPE